MDNIDEVPNSCKWYIDVRNRQTNHCPRPQDFFIELIKIKTNGDADKKKQIPIYCVDEIHDIWCFHAKGKTYRFWWFM